MLKEHSLINKPCQNDGFMSFVVNSHTNLFLFAVLPSIVDLQQSTLGKLLTTVLIDCLMGRARTDQNLFIFLIFEESTCRRSSSWWQITSKIPRRMYLSNCFITRDLIISYNTQKTYLQINTKTNKES